MNYCSHHFVSIGQGLQLLSIDFITLTKCANSQACFYLTDCLFRSMGDDNYMEMLEEDGSGDDEEEYDGKRKRK